MKIIARGKKNGRIWTAGRGTYEEIESLNICNSNRELFKAIKFIMYQYWVCMMHKDPSTMRVNKKIYGKRKIVFG